MAEPRNQAQQLTNEIQSNKRQLYALINNYLPRIAYRRMRTEEVDARVAADELFPEFCSPAILADESVYSWCARFHRLNGGFDVRATSRLLFGHSTAALRHDFPFHLEHFQQKTRGDLGALPALLHARTLFGFHAPFLPADVEDEVRRYLISGRNSVALRKLGLARAGLGIINPLKLCPACTAEQQAQHGFTWWRASQQLPSSHVCDVHNEWLRTSLTSQSRGLMEDFYLPNAHQTQAPPDGEHQLLAHRRLAKLREWGSYVQAQQNLRLTETSLRHSYLLKAKSRGWLAFDGSVRMQQLRDAFLAHYHVALKLFGDEFLGDLSGINAGFLAHLFRQFPSRRHPLKHLLLMNFLFETPEEFIATYEKVSVLRTDGGDEAVQTLLQDSASQLLRLVAEGQSVSRAAAKVGVPATLASRHLDKLGIQRRDRRPRIIGTDKEKQLRELLHEGRSRKEIALAVGVRQAFIKDFLAVRPDLKEIWAEAYYRCQRDLRRQQLTAALQQHPDLRIKTIRRLPGNGFQWLYNNDRDWLQEVLPAIWKRCP